MGLVYFSELFVGLIGATLSAACVVTILILATRYRSRSPSRKSVYRVVMVGFALIALTGGGCFRAIAWPLVEGILEGEQERDYYNALYPDAGMRLERLLTPDEVRAKVAADEAALRAGWDRADQRRATLAEAEGVVRTWNDALDRHDVGALEGFYAEQVQFYGKSLPRPTVLSSKRAVLVGKSTFHQQIIGEVWPKVAGEVDGGAITAITTEFEKRSESAGKVLNVHARLGLQRSDGGTFVIAEETDDVTANPCHVDKDCPNQQICAFVSGDTFLCSKPFPEEPCPKGQVFLRSDGECWTTCKTDADCAEPSVCCSTDPNAPEAICVGNCVAPRGGP
jgi:hypothetical protein